MKNISTWKLVNSSLENRIAVMLLYVLESSGSSPGRQGFFMAVNANSEMEGSIGGGIMEHKFVEMARERIREQEIKGQEIKGQEIKQQEIRKQHHDKSAAKNQSGMICSGEQTILLYRVQKSDEVAIRHIISSMEQNKNGTLYLSPLGINFSTTRSEKDFHFAMQSEEDWVYAEKTGYKKQLFIIGGGHCALALSKLMYSMDFYIRVYDDRKDLKTMVENDAAHEKYLINNYSQLNELIPPGQNNYVVIMTFGYRSDDSALRVLMTKEFRYLGILGSANKIGKMFDGYRKESFSETFLQQVHAPVGLTIKSQTPEEIAVSIAAEIIQIQNK